MKNRPVLCLFLAVAVVIISLGGCVPQAQYEACQRQNDIVTKTPLNQLKDTSIVIFIYLFSQRRA